MTAVLMTGASGRMAAVIRRDLAGRYAPMRLMARRTPEGLLDSEEFIAADLADLDALVEASRGIDVIVHLGGIPDEAPFADILETNIQGTYHVYEAARRAGVPRVVFASTNHVTGFYERAQTITVNDPVRPDTFYGASKVYGEALGRLYHDKWGLEVVSIRIGTFRPEPENDRQLSMWLSHRDGVHLVERAVEAPNIDYLCVYGVSANTRSFWDNAEPAMKLGYLPVDNAEDHADRILAAGPPPADTDEHLRQGGQFVRPDYAGGTW